MNRANRRPLHIMQSLLQINISAILLEFFFNLFANTVFEFACGLFSVGHNQNLVQIHSLSHELTHDLLNRVGFARTCRSRDKEVFASIKLFYVENFITHLLRSKLDPASGSVPTQHHSNRSRNYRGRNRKIFRGQKDSCRQNKTRRQICQPILCGS